MNIVILAGRLSSEPRRTELPSGIIRWNLELSCLVPDGRVLGVPITWDGEVADSWTSGTELAVAGTVRRRFFRTAGATQSRTEVEATAVVEITKRRSRSTALARVARTLDGTGVSLTCDAA